MALARRKKIPPTKYEIIDRLLFNYGSNQIDKDRFWREMNAHGYTQNDIDWWCQELRTRTASDRAKEGARYA